MTKREERLKKLQNRQVQVEGNESSKKWAYSTPKDVPFYKIREGENLIDIVQYKITNPQNPACKAGFEVGEPDYKQIIPVHKNVGASNNEYLCVARMFGKPCPICEAQKTTWDIDFEKAKAMYPTEYVVYNIIDLLEPEKGVQLWRISKFWVEDELQKLSAMKSKRGVPVIYSDFEVGWSIEFYGEEKKFMNNKFMKPGNFNFVKREKQYDESILDKTYPLDKYWNIPKYDEVYNDFNGIYEEEEEVKEVKPTEEEVQKEREQFVEDLKQSAVRETKVEEAKEAPQRPARRERRRKTDEVKKCPHGHAWGDCDKHEECKTCDDSDYDKCADIQDGVLDVKDI